MCIKAGNNELDSVRALMSMSLNALISEVFDKDLEDLDGNLSLYEDLAMNAHQQQELGELIAEYFDGLSIDLTAINTLQELFDSIIEVEFEEMPRKDRE